METNKKAESADLSVEHRNRSESQQLDRTKASTRLSTGVAGLDEILYGGLLPGRAYLLRGGPGTGKTTLGVHFLTTGAGSNSDDEKKLFITFGETEGQVRANAESLGFDLQNVSILDLSPSAGFFTDMESYDIFSPAEVERNPITQRIIEQVEALRPKRVFLDVMTQFRFLSSDQFQFRKQVLAFLRFLTEQGATVLFSSEGSELAPDDDLQFISDGVIHLKLTPDGRTISVTKFRGSNFRSGYHSMRLTGSGMEVYPRLLPENYGRAFTQEAIPSGVRELDELFHGGLERGTISLITGPSGVGKTTLGMQFMKEAASRAERSIVYIFEESAETLLHRCENINIPMHKMIESGALLVVQVDPLRYSADEFAYMVRKAVEEQKASVVMIDSIAGYRLSLKGQDLVAHLHALGKYLQNMGVAVLLINEVEAITGEFKATEVGISYMADNIVFLRYLEMRGEMHKAIGVLKKRLTDFEKTLREIDISSDGIRVGRPLTGLRDILSGTPEWIGPQPESI